MTRNNGKPKKYHHESHTTARIWQRTLVTFRLAASLTGESLVEIMDRVAQKELDRQKRFQAKEMEK